MALIDDINNLPSSVSDGIPGHLNNHQVIHAALKDHESRIGVRHIVGTGSPDGVIAASVGSIYTDTAATNGAIRWIKASGTSTTGWRVQYGDTGWRVLSTDIMTSGGVQVRRINSTVHSFAGSGLYRSFNLSSTSSVSAPGTIPVGFRSDVRVNFIPVILNSSKTTVGALEVLESGNVLTRMSSGYTSVDDLLQSMNTHWITTQSWPTSLPGTPA